MNNIDFHSSIYSEPNSITGGISADGAGNLMGATSLSPIEIVLRETLQNSWDASLGQSTQPVFNINVRSLSESEKNCINNFLSERPPLGTFDRERLDKFLVKENKVVLEISDFGTKGLGGHCQLLSHMKMIKIMILSILLKILVAINIRKIKGENMDMESHLFSTLVAVEQ